MSGTPQNYGVGSNNTLTDGATVTLDFSQWIGNSFKLTLGGNRTFATWLNAAPGMKFDLLLYQDGTGSRTMTWPTNVLWAAGTAPTLTTTALAFDFLRFTYHTAIGWLGETVGKAYA